MDRDGSRVLPCFRCAPGPGARSAGSISLTPTDIHNVEYLADKEVLRNLTGGFRWLKRNNKEHAIAYFEAFADLLEEKLLASIDVSVEPPTKGTKTYPVFQANAALYINL
jgi:hypothetical protein